MRIHQHSNIDFNFQGVFVGISELNIFDVNHGLSPNLTHDDCVKLFQEIAEIMTPGPAVSPYPVPEHAPVGYRMDQENFPRFRQILRAGNYTQGAETIIRNVLAVVATIVKTPQGNHRICKIYMYLHFDMEPP